METTEQQDQAARAFIALQKAKFDEAGVTGMTRRQRARVNALDVVDADDRYVALKIARDSHSTLGPPPHGDTGQMRVIDMHTGEIRIQRAPKRRRDVDLEANLEAELEDAA